jgi:hypothetical protein
MHQSLSTVCLAATLCSLLSANSVFADVIVLYDDTQGNLPADQPWLIYGSDSIFSGGSASQVANASGVNLTTDNAVSAGYSNTIPIINTFKNPAFPTLDRSRGFELSFELQVLNEAHVSNDRAGFSVILLADDARGIELGFWEDEIWAQNDTPLFTKGEGVGFDTTQSEVRYDLQIIGNQYSLSANGSQLFSSLLRDYSAFGGPPYTLGNYLFLGDNTSSASASVNLGRVTMRAVPEPGTVGLLLILTAVVWTGWRRHVERPGNKHRGC